MRKRSITTLWELVSKLQANLEQTGLESEDVDAAVVLGIEAILEHEREQAIRRHSPVWLQPAQA